MQVSYDLHIHSGLSPCGDDEMTPNNIANMAYVKGLDVISVTDHNSMVNVKPIFELGKERDIIVIPGMEVTTKEEVHVLCYFKSLEDGLRFSDIIYESLIEIWNKEEIFGKQLIYDKFDNIIKSEEKLLINTSRYSLSGISKLVYKYNGILIPAHIDKMSNSVISTLGFIPEDLNIKSVEITKKINNSPLKKIIDKLEYNKIINSDAHYLKDINEPINFIEVKDRTLIGVFDSLDNNWRK